MKKTILLSALFAIGIANAVYADESLQQVPQQVAENDVKIHRVALGETMVIIAKKYMVLPQDIYDINPGSAEGLSAGMTLKIPVGKKVKAQTEEKNLDYQLVDAASLRDKKPEPKAQPQYVTEAKSSRSVSNTSETVKPDVKTETVAELQNVNHEVKPGETLSGLARKYNTTITAITEANEKTLKRGLQSGQSLIIPAAGGYDTTSANATAIASSPKEVQEFTGTHHVKSGETLHSLARKYNTTVADITAANEKLLKRGLQAGQTLVVPVTEGAGQDNEAVAAAETVVVPNHASYSEEPTGNTEHKVESGETLHGLARKYNTSVEAITAANKQKLKRGLQAGQLIKIPVPIALAANVNEQ